MNFFRRIVFCVVVSFAVGCSKGDPETVEPVAKPETVIIGCSGASGAEIDVRTQLVGDGAVYWDKTDEIRLWASVHGDKNFSACVENEPFRFDYYSASKSRAGFAGNADLSKFDAANTYDYYAVSPAPAADAVKGTEVIYTIPAEQTGEYDGRYDILTAKLDKGAPALKAGDDNPSVNLKFDHHIHLLKFTIVSNAWEKERPVRAVELTFPRAVVGELTVDATDPTVNKLDDTPEGRKVMIKFPAGKERKLGETFYAMIAPTEIGSGETIGMRIIGTLGETSAEIPAAGKSLAGGHTTPVDLNVKAMTTRYNAVTLTFNVSDNEGGIGENTLGERVNEVRVKGSSEDTFYKAILEPSDKCRFEGSDVIFTVPNDGSPSAEYSVIFLPKDENPDYLWPEELRDRDFTSISGKRLKVEYKSESAWIRTIEGYSTVQTKEAISFDSNNRCSVDLLIPYFFEENFSGVSNVGDKSNPLFGNSKYYGEKNDEKNHKGEDLGPGFLYSGWTGNQVRGYSTYIEIKTRVEHFFAAGHYPGRLISAPMQYWREDKEPKKLKVQFGYSYYTDKENTTQEMIYGTTEKQGSINAKHTSNLPDGEDLAGKTVKLKNGDDKTMSDWVIESPSDLTRLFWELKVEGDERKNNGNRFLRLSNLKVSIVE